METNFFIKLKNGSIVPVSEELYREYKRPEWRESYRRRTCAVREISYEYISEQGCEINAVSSQKLTEDIVVDKMMIELLMNALVMLTDEERKIIDALYFKEKTEREAATITNISQQTVHWKKRKILLKLKKLLKM